MLSWVICSDIKIQNCRNMMLFPLNVSFSCVLFVLSVSFLCVLYFYKSSHKKIFFPSSFISIIPSGRVTEQKCIISLLKFEIRFSCSRSYSLCGIGGRTVIKNCCGKWTCACWMRTSEGKKEQKRNFLYSIGWRWAGGGTSGIKFNFGFKLNLNGFKI